MNGSGAVSFDTEDLYPEVAFVRERLAARDWDGVAQVLDGLEPTRRTAVVDLAADLVGVEHMLRNVLERDPADGGASALLAYRLIHIGWKARSDHRAEDVSEEQFAQFRDWLTQAEAVLIEGAAHNPRDPAIWTARLLTARGLRVGLAETRRRYDKVAALDPRHLPAQTLMVQSLAPKWGGSWELLHPWCRDVALAAPPGAIQGRLVAEGHLEHWLRVSTGSDAAYLKGAPVRAELDEAAQRSVLHPGFGREDGWLYAARLFAFLFSLIGDRRSAAPLFRLLGDRATRYPWAYLGDPADQFRRHRRLALDGATP